MSEMIFYLSHTKFKLKLKMPATIQRKHDKTWVLAVDTRGTTPQPSADTIDTSSITSSSTTLPAEIIPFQHPRTKRLAPLVFYNNKLYDIQFLTHPIVGDELKEGPASWFVGNSVVSDGRLGMVTPIDPLFLVIPFLTKNGSKYTPLDQIFPMSTPEAPNTHLLSKQSNMTSQLSHLCDVNDKYGPDMIFFRYNEEKTLKWIQKKIKNVKQLLDINPNIYSKCGSDGPQFSKIGTSSEPGNNDSALEKSRWNLATATVSEYLTDDLIIKVRQILALEGKINHVIEKRKIVSPARKRKSTEISSSSSSGNSDSSSSSNSSSNSSIKSVVPSVVRGYSNGRTAKEELEALMYGGVEDQTAAASSKPKKKAKVAMKPVPKGQKSVMSFFTMSAKKKKK
jgi:ribonuclease H2 subunit B